MELLKLSAQPYCEPAAISRLPIGVEPCLEAPGQGRGWPEAQPFNPPLQLFLAGCRRHDGFEKDSFTFGAGQNPLPPAREKGQ